ncbi:MAG: putative lipid II flippase FtsW [Rickettsiaceae bacterium]|nr:putative lipid II flippase FtsW [Rickettsiaceae bacterium]
MDNNFFWRWWRAVDQQTIIALAILFGFSMMLVTTSGPAVASRIGLDESYFSVRQLFYLSGAAIIILSLSCLDKQLVSRLAIAGFVASFLLLVLVKFYGYEVKGARRWISIFGFSMQPSEFIKPFLAVVTAWILSLKKYSDFPGFTISLILYLAVATVLIIQPDFGMFIMVSAVWVIQLFVSGMPIIWIGIAFISGLFGVTAAYILLPHVAQRINSFLDPASSENYQVTKSIMAFENGGLYGRGPGEGTVKQVLPDSHTDFIFAVAGEEFGAVVCLVIAAIFAFIVVRGIIRLLHEEDQYVILAVTGILSQFGLQSAINMGVTLNLLPTKGMTLPFISYGGSSTLAIAVAIGILLSFTKRRTIVKKYKIIPEV